MDNVDEAPERRVRERKVYRVRVDPFTEFYTPRRFMARFRLDQATVEMLADEYGASAYAATLGTGVGKGLSHRERVCLALRYYATGGHYRLIADTQHVSTATVCRAIASVTLYLQHNHERYIRWPEAEEYPAVARGFYGKAGFPRVIGAIDGTHIPIMKAIEDERVFVNRKGYHSLNVMCVVDSQMIFTYVNPRMPGGSHDAYVFGTSGLHRELEEDVAEGFTLLGDSGYPLCDYLLTPVQQPANPGEEAYNRAHCSTRSIIEQAFGLLKMRFRCLTGSGGFIMSQPGRCSAMVLAITCLHNLAIRRGVQLDGIEPPDAVAMYPQPNNEREREMRPRGIERRNVLIEYFAEPDN